MGGRQAHQRGPHGRQSARPRNVELFGVIVFLIVIGMMMVGMQDRGGTGIMGFVFCEMMIVVLVIRRRWGGGWDHTGQ